jgi:hypothetical protein
MRSVMTSGHLAGIFTVVNEVQVNFSMKCLANQYVVTNIRLDEVPILCACRPGIEQLVYLICYH